MNFQRGQDPMKAMGLGREANPIQIFRIEELHHKAGSINIESYTLSQAREFLWYISTGSESEVLFNIQDRNFLLVEKNGNSRDIKHIWGDWVCLPGMTIQIPEFLKPKGASRL